MSVLESPRVGNWCRCASLVVALCTTSSAAGTNFAVVFGGSGQDYAASVTTDAAGNTYIAGLTYSPDLHVTPGALQTTIGGNGTLANPASIAGDAFVAKFGPDGGVIWCTFLGGSGLDYATGVGVDSAGNVLVTGWTRSLDFPVFRAAQSVLNGGVSPYRWDAFVAKLDPTGSKLIYSTYLGGPDDDGAYGLAVDASGNAYVTGQVGTAAGFMGFSNSATGFGMFVSKLNPQGELTYIFFHPNITFADIGAAAAIAVDSAGAAYVTGTASSYYPITTTHQFGPQGATQALVFKLAPDGSHMLYETTLGGSVDADGMAIAVDNTGAAYVAGITDSVDFPLASPVQSTLGARPLWKSPDDGATWKPLDNLPFAFLKQIVADPAAPTAFYAATSDRGVFKSTDSGATWSGISSGITGTSIQALAIDPKQPQTLYAATGSGLTASAVYKTVNGGSTWAMVDSSTTGQPLQLAVDAVNPDNVYAVWSNVGARKSSDGGATWTTLPFPGLPIRALALDPHISGSVWVYSTAFIQKPPAPSTPSYIWHSIDGGLTWVQLTSPAPASPGWLIDGSTNPSTIYNGLSDRSTDNGATWTALPASPVSASNTGAVAVDPAGALYTSAYNAGIFVSRDHGQSWQNITAVTAVEPGFVANIMELAPVGTGGTLFAILQNPQNSSFVTKLSPDGSSMIFSTLLNGHVSLAPSTIYAAEPGNFLTQNWIYGIALDASNNVILAGGTRARDFPMANPQRPGNTGKADAFVTILAADGSKWNYSTYYGGSDDDSALAVALDNQGNLVLAGQTWSSDFPVVNGTQAQHGVGDAFVLKLAPNNPPTITSVLNGASYLPGIEAGSWAMIKGNNLANTTRPWSTDDFNGNNLPTSLNGVSVTIDGQPAFVSYISATQINVQVPSDSTVGSVNVVVDNNGAVSAPAPAQLQSYAPALFMIPGTSAVIASVLPGYTLVTSSAPAHPGDTLVLWATGFGPTTPQIPAGTVVSGIPVAATPTVTIGGMGVPVLNSLLAPDGVGVYQITIQLPDNVPTGTVAIQASVGGAQTQSDTTIFVRKP